ncbi:unnamed product [Ostreococcus tauri]|uniref:Unnamed product n=1 Tax=Ostreococcus tauri TaxID=70448 RepID=Q00YF0_OSTTA|nr:unnamed product [Ostreococcus tauri]CAL57101.1 unnamed product [Ostreococcus tauri]|eukprot:XP_003082155.1 unnamed product [Ostreococcus tauri]
MAAETCEVRPPMRLNGAQSRGAAHCWATRADGEPCARPSTSTCEIPYCDFHLKRGDEALEVRAHPSLGGKILVAARDLPRGYKTVYLGERKSWRECGRKGRDHAMHFLSRGGVIDPTPLGHAAQLQFMANPGPNEVSNNRSTNVFFGDARDPVGTLVGREFILFRPVPKGHQLLQWYGAEWFASRDIKRLDVGCEKYPAERKRGRRESDLADEKGSRKRGGGARKRRALAEATNK